MQYAGWFDFVLRKIVTVTERVINNNSGGNNKNNDSNDVGNDDPGKIILNMHNVKNISKCSLTVL